MAQIMANMGDYIQPQSLLNLNIEAEQSQEHSTHSKDTSEEMHEEKEAEAEASQEVVEKTRVTSPEEPSQDNMNTKDVFQTENMEASQGKGTVLEEQNLTEQPSLAKETIVPPRNKKKKTNKIERLWKE